MENNNILNNGSSKVTGDYLRIRPGTDISINTPILYLNIGYGLLKSVDLNSSSTNRVYEVDIKKIRNILRRNLSYMFEAPEHINDYVPVGQVDTRYRGDTDNSQDPNISIILANTRVVPMTKQYRQIRNNVWLAETDMNGTKMRSIGTILSKSKPNYGTPVFPIAYLKKISDSEPNYDVYSDRSHGRYSLNDTALNIDKKNLRMFDSTGDISLIPSSVFVPMTPYDLYENDADGTDMRYNRKVYFTTQGTIANDPNCVKPRDNMMKMNILECNGISSTTDSRGSSRSRRSRSGGSIGTIEPMSNNDQDNNERVDGINNFDNIKSGASKPGIKFEPYRNTDNTMREILTGRKKKLILREKDEPWFTDPTIVGDIAVYDDPHTVTGHDNTLEMTDSEIYDIIEDLKPKGSLGALKGDSDTLVLIGTFDGDTNEINAPFTSDCIVDPVIGYSRYDKLQKCLNEENRNGLGRKIENFDSVEPNYNNYIMWIICFMIIALIIYKFRR